MSDFLFGRRYYRRVRLGSLRYGQKFAWQNPDTVRGVTPYFVKGTWFKKVRVNIIGDNRWQDLLEDPDQMVYIRRTAKIRTRRRFS